MKLREMFEHRKPVISPEEQNAFRQLGKELIFTEDVDLPLTPENSNAISEKIQKQFTDLQESIRQKTLKEDYQFDKGFGHLGEEGLRKEYEDHGVFPPRFMDLPEKEFLVSMHLSFSAVTHFDKPNAYDPRGFTPKLAQFSSKDSIEANCVGLTTMFGAYCKRRGLKTEFGVTADHAVAFVEAEGEMYMVDGQRAPVLLRGKFEQKDGYKIYYPSDDEGTIWKNDDEKDKKPVEQKMIMVYDFNQGVLHEVLENVAVLRDVSEGKNSDLVPGSQKDIESAATRYAQVLQKADWRLIQRKLFPTIDRSMKENEAAWSLEVERMKDFRKKERKTSVMFDILFAAQSKTSLAGSNFKEAQTILRDMGKSYKESIIDFLFHAKDLPVDMPVDARSFYATLGSLLQNIDGEVKDYILEKIKGALEKTENVDKKENKG